MLPQQSTRTFIIATLAIGTVPEPDLTNEQFLASYLDHSCWLRVLSAKQSLSIVQQPSAGKLDKLAALAAFYQTAGLAVEDALSMYIAWSLWSHNKSQSIPSILERLSLRLSEPSGAMSATYAADIANRMLNSSKRVDVYARAYLSQVINVPDKKLPNTFGIAWKLNPSVKLVPKDMLPDWNKLGENMRDSIRALLDPRGSLLAACYNKIKHGPQITIMRPYEAAAQRGFSDEQIRATTSSHESIRLLLKGGRLQETETEVQEKIRAAPFLPLDAENMKRWFFQQIVHTSNALFICGTWIFNPTFMETKRSLVPAADEIHRIIREQQAHLRNTFGI